MHVEEEAIACTDRWLYSKQQHSRLQEERREGGKLPPHLLKSPKKVVTPQPGFINTYTVT
jgi:hypothetical protein